MIVVIGEILIDMFKDYHRIGGAPFNFAFHLKHLGFPVRFLTRVGDDQNGRRIIGMLKECGFSEADIQIDSRFPTGTVHVDLDGDGVPQFDIIENVAYDHLDLDIGRIEDAGPTGMIYFGTLVQRTDSGFRQVQRFLDRQGSAATCFCDINMRPPHVNAQAVAGSLLHADLLKLNEAELAEILRAFEGPATAGEGIGWLMDKFEVSTLALTRGERGSTLYRRHHEISRPAMPGTGIIDTVGAGDGYAAILAAGYLRNIPWAETIEQASRFASRICGIPGAVPDDQMFYDDFRPSMKGQPNGR